MILNTPPFMIIFVVIDSVISILQAGAYLREGHMGPMPPPFTVFYTNFYYMRNFTILCPMYANLNFLFVPPPLKTFLNTPLISSIRWPYP
jgi:hypothetical protein